MTGPRMRPFRVLARSGSRLRRWPPMSHEHFDDGEQAHDVLAAEEFVIPAPDPVLHELAGEAHDVLAAEEFALGSADPALARHPFVPPADPADPDGAEQPHDVLAAEEFALPAAPPGSRVPISAAPAPLRRVALAAAVVLVLTAWRHRRRS